MHPTHRVDRTATGPIAVRFGVEIGLEHRLQHQLGGRLHNPITNGRDAERPLASTGLRDHHATHRPRPVGLLPKLPSQSRQPLLHTRRLDRLERHTIDPGRALVGFRQGIRMGEDVSPIDLVVEQVEAEARLRLGLRIKLALERLDLLGGCQAHRQSRSPFHTVASPSQAGASPSTGIARLR